MTGEVEKLIDAGQKALAVYDYKGALSKFKKALKLDENNPEAHFGYAEASLGIEKIPAEEIIEHYKKAIEGNPQNAFYHARLGAFLLDIGQYDEAEKYYARAAELDPEGHAYYWSELAIGYYQNWLSANGEDASPEEEERVIARTIEYLLRSINIDKERALEILQKN